MPTYSDTSENTENAAEADHAAAAETADGLVETSGPTALAMGDVADGQALKRSGSEVVGYDIDLPVIFIDLAEAAVDGYLTITESGGDYTTGYTFLMHRAAVTSGVNLAIGAGYLSSGTVRVRVWNGASLLADTGAVAVGAAANQAIDFTASATLPKNVVLTIGVYFSGTRFQHCTGTPFSDCENGDMRILTGRYDAGSTRPTTSSGNLQSVSLVFTA